MVSYNDSEYVDTSFAPPPHENFDFERFGHLIGKRNSKLPLGEINPSLPWYRKQPPTPLEDAVNEFRYQKFPNEIYELIVANPKIFDPYLEREFTMSEFLGTLRVSGVGVKAGSEEPFKRVLARELGYVALDPLIERAVNDFFPE